MLIEGNQDRHMRTNKQCHKANLVYLTLDAMEVAILRIAQ